MVFPQNTTVNHSMPQFLQPPTNSVE